MGIGIVYQIPTLDGSLEKERDGKKNSGEERGIDFIPLKSGRTGQKRENNITN